MVYIRPSSPIVMPTAVKPVYESPHAPDEDSATSDNTINEYVKPQRERRDQQQDRRQQRKDALLESRVGRDRRKHNVTINISI